MFSIRLNLLLSCCVLTSLSTSLAVADPGLSPNSLHIVATIDHDEEIHISHRRAVWIHKGGQPPKKIRINGRPWDPNLNAAWAPGDQRWLVPKHVALSGAVLRQRRGRNPVRLSCDANGLVVRFLDPQCSVDTYEITIEFAQMIVKEQTSSEPPKDLELRIKARIDGMEEIFFARDQATWTHHEWRPPEKVTVNGRPLNVTKSATLKLNSTLMPETMNLRKATLAKVRGRGIASLDCRPEGLYLVLEDHAAGADDYEVILKVPRFRNRHLVRVKGGRSGALLGAPLRIYRTDAKDEGRALLTGQRVFGARGQCFAALEPGQYQFEVLHKAGPQTLVALKTGPITIDGPTTVDLMSRWVKPRLYGPKGRRMLLDELSVRSTRKTGAVSLKMSRSSKRAMPTLLLSKGQNYNIHAFGHTKNVYATIWKTATLLDIAKITLDKEELLACSFRWRKGTPHAASKGIVLHFPDGQMEISQPESAKFFTNRRSFALAYWLAFSGDRKAVFQPRGCVLSPDGGNDFVLGGPLSAVASADIMEDENLGKPNALRLWWEITLRDPQSYLLDTSASKIQWKPVLSMKDGSAISKAPLTPKAIKRLGNLKDTLIASAGYEMGSAEKVSVAPEQFVDRKSTHCFTRVPPYRGWNTEMYLMKAERELEGIAMAIRKPLNPKHRVEIKWWLNHGAVGGVNHGSVTMPFPTYLNCVDRFSHPWAIAHEMLHNFGYGHTHEMVRLDRIVQEYMEHFRWRVADHPEYVPE